MRSNRRESSIFTHGRQKNFGYTFGKSISGVEIVTVNLLICELDDRGLFGILNGNS